MNLSSRDGSAFSLAFEFVTAIVVGAGGGYLLDRQFHSSPWCLLVGLLLGAVAAFTVLLRLAKTGSKSDGPGPTDPGAS